MVFVHDLIDDKGKIQQVYYVQNILQDTNIIEIQGLLNAVWNLLNKYDFSNYSNTTQISY